GRDGQAALGVRMSGVEAIHGAATGGEIAGDLELVPDRLDARGVLHRLAVMRSVTFAIEVALAHHIGRESQLAGNTIEDLLDDQHALRPAETAKRRLRCLVRFANVACDV